LIVELDGQVHQNPTAMEYDEKRTMFLNGLGYKVKRFENKMVFDNLRSVLMEIRENTMNE
jgi:very-short-patch-repair endonuclease